MLSNETIAEGSIFSIRGVIGTLLPQRTRHRIVLFVAILGIVCLVSSISLTISAQRNRVLLVSAPIQQAMTAKGGASPAASRATFTSANASKALVRLNQLDPAQYNSQQDYNTWAYSTCSSAAMTVVINSYGHNYRIADILKVEAGLHEITPDLGLLEPTGIDRTVAQFGFTTNWLSSTVSLDNVIKVANQGHPVIVGFPPALWSGGHLLVVRGGTSQDVFLADSSRLNMQTMARSTFLKYWAGFAVVVTPASGASPSSTSVASVSTSTMSVVGKPTLTSDFINRVLETYHSPAAGKGQALYDLGVRYGIDPAFALAFFMHESSFGTAGEAMKTLSLGNLRCYDGSTCVDQDRGGYASYPSWEDGFEAWYVLIRNVYVQQWSLTTIDTIIPTYAPPVDRNDDAAYIASLKHAIVTWHAGILKP